MTDHCKKFSAESGNSATPQTHGESRFNGLRGSPRCLHSRFRLSKRQPCMIEKGPPGGGQFDAVHAAAHQLDANLVFEIADLAAEGRLRRVQPILSRERQAASSATAMK